MFRQLFKEEGTYLLAQARLSGSDLFKLHCLKDDEIGYVVDKHALDY